MFKKYRIKILLNSFNNHKPGYSRFNCKTTKSFNLCNVERFESIFQFKIILNQNEEFIFKYWFDLNKLCVCGYNNFPIEICSKQLTLESKLNNLYSNFYDIYDVIRKEFHIQYATIFEKEKSNIENELDRLTYISKDFRFTYMEFKFADVLTKQDLIDVLYVKDCLNDLIRKYKCYYTISYHLEVKKVTFNITMDTYKLPNVIYPSYGCNHINSRLEDYIDELN